MWNSKKRGSRVLPIVRGEVDMKYDIANGLMVWIVATFVAFMNCFVPVFAIGPQDLKMNAEMGLILSMIILILVLREANRVRRGAPRHSRLSPLVRKFTRNPPNQSDPRR